MYSEYQIPTRAKLVKFLNCNNLPIEHDIVRKKIRQQTLNYPYRQPKHQEYNGAEDNLQQEKGQAPLQSLSA